MVFHDLPGCLGKYSKSQLYAYGAAVHEFLRELSGWPRGLWGMGNSHSV